MIAITQNGKTIFSQEDDGVFVPIVFNNLTGRNFGGEEYRNYIKMMMHDFSGLLTTGVIEYRKNGVVLDKGTITNYQ